MLCLYLLFEIFFQPFFGFFHLTGQLIYPESCLAGTFGGWVLYVTTYVRLGLVPPAVVLTLAYEYYHKICCNYREAILLANMAKKQNANTSDAEAVTPINDAEKKPLVAHRKAWQWIDWAGLPFALFVYYIVPDLYAIFWQIFTDRLDYKVSMKPTAASSAQSFGTAVDTSDPTPESAGSSDVDAASEKSFGGVKKYESKLSGGQVELELEPIKLALPLSDGHAKVMAVGGKGHGPRDSGVEVDLLRV
jgi:hypothetical protein